MAYEKQTWTTGEVITAEKLNHMEDGIGGSESSGETNGGATRISGLGTSLIKIDKSWNELNNMAKTGLVIAIIVQTKPTLPTGGTMPDDLVPVETVTSVYPLRGLNANINPTEDGFWTQYVADFGEYQFEHSDPDATMYYQDEV